MVLSPAEASRDNGHLGAEFGELGAEHGVEGREHGIHGKSYGLYGRGQGHYGALGGKHGDLGRRSKPLEGDNVGGCPKGKKKTNVSNWQWLKCFADLPPGSDKPWAAVVRRHFPEADFSTREKVKGWTRRLKRAWENRGAIITNCALGLTVYKMTEGRTSDLKKANCEEQAYKDVLRICLEKGKISDIEIGAVLCSVMRHRGTHRRLRNWG